MNNRLNNRLEGLENGISHSFERLNHFDLNKGDHSDFSHMIYSMMEYFGYDEITQDEAGNIIGIIRGLKRNEDIVLLSNIDIPLNDEMRGNNQGKIAHHNFDDDKAGIITSLYTGVLLKHSMAMLTGDLIVACVTRNEFNNHGIKQLFKGQLKNRKIKGVILSEPTNFEIYLGSKGRLEYEIVVHESKDHYQTNIGKVLRSNESNLFNSLNEVSDRLPYDNELGKSTLAVRNIQYVKSYPDKESDEMHIQVDRTFNLNEKKEAILQNAKRLAKDVYTGIDIDIDTHVNKDKITTPHGKMLREVQEYKPWKMEGYHPFVTKSFEVLSENGFQPSAGYWKKKITEGSFTKGALNIPTIGFGAGQFESTKNIGMDELKKSIFGKALIVYSQIGLPTFGWDDDEI